MLKSRKHADALWHYKKYIVRLIQTLKKTKNAIIAEYNNDALHDFRVAVRKLRSLDVLSEKTVGFCFSDELRERLKAALTISSDLRDMEELIRVTPKMSGEFDNRRAAYLSELIAELENFELQTGLLYGYIPVYEMLKEQKSKIAHIRDAALEVVIEDMQKTSKRYAKIAKSQSVDFDELHFVRKRCKRYRYQLEFLFLGGNEGSLICKRIQDKLGTVNDIRVWLEIVGDKNASVSSRLSGMLEDALKKARVEALLFASKKYCNSLATELRRRMAIY
jgi:CHAD domain-containing protein